MKNLSICFFVMICLASCKEGTPDKVTVDSVCWGEEIVYNESGHDLTMIIYGSEGDELSLEIPDGQSDTLDLPSMEYVVSITMSSDSVKIVFDDGRQITTIPSEDLLYGTYELEEKTVYENGAAVDKLWPIYRYRITGNHYDASRDEGYKVTVDSAYWGEEIVYNESGHDLTMIIYGREGDELSLEIPDGQSDTLDLPSMEYVASITMSSDSVKIVFDDGRQITTIPSEDLLYGTYELEEKTVYENGAAVDKLWPIYRYRITEKHYNVSRGMKDLL